MIHDVKDSRLWLVTHIPGSQLKLRIFDKQITHYRFKIPKKELDLFLFRTYL